MTRVRRSFTDEFKREAVALLQTSGRPLMQIASELGIQPSMLRKWRNAVLRVPAGVSQRPNTQAVSPQAGTSYAGFWVTGAVRRRADLASR